MHIFFTIFFFFFFLYIIFFKTDSYSHACSRMHACAAINVLNDRLSLRSFEDFFSFSKIKDKSKENKCSLWRMAKYRTYNTYNVCKIIEKILKKKKKKKRTQKVPIYNLSSPETRLWLLEIKGLQKHVALNLWETNIQSSRIFFFICHGISSSFVSGIRTDSYKL